MTLPWLLTRPVIIVSDLEMWTRLKNRHRLIVNGLLMIDTFVKLPACTIARDWVLGRKVIAILCSQKDWLNVSVRPFRRLSSMFLD